MNKELVKVAKEALEAGKTGILQVANFAKEQAPILVEQLLKWKFAIHAVWASIGLLGVLAALWWNIRWVRNKNSFYYEYEGKGPMITIWFFTYLIFVLIFLIAGATAMKIAIAPNLYIFEYIVRWIK